MNSDLEAFYKKLTKARATVTRKMLKKSPAILKDFVDDQLIRTGPPLFGTALPNREWFHSYIKCWKKDPIGTKDLRTCLSAAEGHPCILIIVVSSSGFTNQLVKFAQSASRPILLYHLDELIMTYHS